jgi:hypothetical protein
MSLYGLQMVEIDYVDVESMHKLNNIYTLPLVLERRYTNN